MVTSNLKNSINIVLKVPPKFKNMIQKLIKIPKLDLTLSCIKSISVLRLNSSTC